MAFDGDILQIKVFSDCSGYAGKAMNTVTKQVNDYLHNYPANLIHSIQSQVTELTETSGDYPETMTRYTVTVVLKG